MTSMDRWAVMLSVAKRIRPAFIGIVALLCANAALIALGWLAVLEAPAVDVPIAKTAWTPPSLDLPTVATDRAGAAEPDDPVLARPIFFPARKPFEPPPVSEAVEPPKPPPPDPVFVVDGIILAAGIRKVHARRPQEADGQWYKMGEIIDGWKIIQIDPLGIILEQADRKFTARLYESDSSAFQTVRRHSRRAAQ